MNPILRLLILGDLVTYVGYGLAQPILAIFIAERIEGGSVAVAGFAATVFLVVKAIVQLFVAKFTDGDVGYLREYWTMVIGYAVFASGAFVLAGVTDVAGLYLVQVLHGVGAAFAYPGWMVLFTRFADRQREGREWTLYSTVVVIGMALAASLGAWLVERVGFRPVFLAMGWFGVAGTIAIAFLGRYYTILRRDVREQKQRLSHGRTAHR